MKKRNILVSSVSLLLTLIMTVLLAISAFAEDTVIEQYVKDVKLIYAESLDEAKTYVADGYKLIETDINQGSDGDYQVYMSYSTTTNPDEAVTDIKMMNMNGGFVFSDYDEQMKNVKDSVKSVAKDFRIAAEAFAANYIKGTYGAKAAYHSLSVFTVDEANGQSLADYFIYGNPSDEFYIKLVLNVHQNILSAILSALTMAVQGEEGNTWLDRLSKIENPMDVEEEPDYWDRSNIIWEHLYSFYNVYNTIDHSLYKNGNPVEPKPEDKGSGENAPPPDMAADTEEPDINLNGTEAIYEVAYNTIAQYSFASGEKFNEWFLGSKIFDLEYCEMIYCMLEILTPEEYAMMRLCGPVHMILATGMDQEVYADYVSRVDEVTGGEETVSVWEGVNTELFHSSIGVTDEAARAIAETEFEQGLNNDGDSESSRGLRTAGFIAACSAVSLGVGLIGYYGFGSLLFSCFGGAGIGAITTHISFVAMIFGSVALALGVVVAVAALVVAVIYIIVWIKELINEYHPTYTPIPEYMYDYVTDSSGNAQFTLYKSVTFQDGRIADVNVWDGKEWHAMYLSHDKASGAPIEADFKVKIGDGRIDEGFAGLSNFGYSNAENMNHFDFDDEVNGIYVTYRQKNLKGDYARGKYLADVHIISGTDVDKCKLELTNRRFVVYDLNLTPDSGFYTYLGYKTTNRADKALTDIRFAYRYNSAQYAAGGGSSTYAASGTTQSGELTLYATRISLFGSPILSDFLILNDRNAPKGYEPVNLFSGGTAVNINLGEGIYEGETTPTFLYFLPSVTYTGGTEYLGGLVSIFDVPDTYFNNGPISLQMARIQLDYNLLYTTYGDENLEGALFYTTTYNPYRAIYGITSVAAGGTMGSHFAQTIFYDGVGYSQIARYLVSGTNKIRHEFADSRTGDARLYVASAYSGGTPMRVSDLHVSADRNGAPDGFIPVSARLSSDGRAVDLAGGFTTRLLVAGTQGQFKKVSLNPFYLFVRTEPYVEGDYITNIYLSSKEYVIGSVEMDCEDLNTAYVMDTLAANGAHGVIGKNLNLEDSDNATYLGYTKDKDSKLPITNVILYYAPDSNTMPDSKLEINRVVYHRVDDIDIFCEADNGDEKSDRVYLYYTTNPAHGSSIIDIKIDNNHILDGWETVKTQNGRALYEDMDDYEDDMWFIHVKRISEEPKYISEIVVGVGGTEAEAKAELIAAGCEYMLEKDMNAGVGIASDYIYIGYKRTSDPNAAIRDIRTTHDNVVDSFIKNGATYHKIDGNLNAYTNVFADDIYLYYTKDASAGTPVTSLGTSKTVASWTHGDGGRYVVKTVYNQYGEPSDLNDGAGGDYIYLLITRDKQDETGLASMIGEGSVTFIIVFAVLSIGAVAFVIIQKKHRANVGAKAENRSEKD